MQTVQSSILVLYTSLLNAGSSNRYGTANVNFTDLTFTNINIRQIIGDIYDKYYKFNLMLSSIVIPIAPADIANGNESVVMFYMGGLPFDNSVCYSTVSQSNNNISLFANIKLDTKGATNSVSDIATFSPSFFNTFLRPSSDNIDITIALRSGIATFTGNVPSFLLPTATVYPRFVYSFNIVPVLDTAILPFPSNEENSLVYRQRLIK